MEFQFFTQNEQSKVLSMPLVYSSTMVQCVVFLILLWYVSHNLALGSYFSRNIIEVLIPKTRARNSFFTGVLYIVKLQACCFKTSQSLPWF